MRSRVVVARRAEPGALNIALLVVLVASVCVAIAAFVYAPRLYMAIVAVLMLIGFVSSAAAVCLRRTSN